MYGYQFSLNYFIYFFLFFFFHQNKRKSKSPVTTVLEKEPPIKKIKTVSHHFSFSILIIFVTNNCVITVNHLFLLTPKPNMERITQVVEQSVCINIKRVKVASSGLTLSPPLSVRIEDQTIPLSA